MASLFRVEGILPSNRGQDARDTQGRDALATKKTIPKLRRKCHPAYARTDAECVRQKHVNLRSISRRMSMSLRVTLVRPLREKSAMVKEATTVP